MMFRLAATLIALVTTLPPADLAGEFDRIATAANGHVGATAMLIETGESAGIHRGDPFPMQSVYKLPIALAVLNQAEAGKFTLDQLVRVGPDDLVPAAVHSPIRDAHPTGGFDLSLQELIRYAIVESDGSASDVLMRLAGGPTRITSYLTGIGVTNMTIATTETEMATSEDVQYRNHASPDAAVTLLKMLFDGRGVSAAHRALLLQFLSDSTLFPSRIKGLLPAGTVVSHKTGTSGTSDGLTRATNDIGIVTLPNGRHLAIAVFVSDSPADSATRESVIAKIARAAWDHWTTR